MSAEGTGSAFRIRQATSSDLPEMERIYERARAFMAEHGNPTQWGPRRYPPRDRILSDITQGKAYVCLCGETVCAVFYYDYGRDPEPTYLEPVEGEWLAPGPYGVVHRIASDGSVRGAGRFCLRWAMERAGHIRIDTHKNNSVMQNLLTSLGFCRVGIIRLPEATDNLRLAYEWTGEKKQEE